MDAATYDVAGFTKTATKYAPQRKGLFVGILRSLQQSRMYEARRVIIKYAHLLPEEQKAGDVVPFIVADQATLG